MSQNDDVCKFLKIKPIKQIPYTVSNHPHWDESKTYYYNIYPNIESSKNKENLRILRALAQTLEWKY